VRYADLCRRRHKSAYADCRIMPSRTVNVVVRAAGAAAGSA
jgi:hypothetical protein